MCGRYRLSRRKEYLAKHFGVDPDETDWEPRYNIAPDAADPRFAAGSQGTRTPRLHDALGADSLLGKGAVNRSSHDQRTF